MNKIVIAGSTGYLGSYIVRELIARKMDFSAIARNTQKLEQLGLASHQIIKAQVTEKSTLKGCLEGAHTVISTVGITRQKDGLNYMDVDYQANMNLLNEALRTGVKKFIYISAIGGTKYRHLKIFQAKESFVDALKNSGLDYTILRPNGFFSDMQDFLQMAAKGKVYLFGKGDKRLNPIHGEDLAEVVVDAIASSKKEIEVGGPDILSHDEIAEMALRAYQKPVKIVHLPDWTRRAAIHLARTFTSPATYGPVEFFMTMMGDDQIATRYGKHRLQHFFEESAKA